MHLQLFQLTCKCGHLHLGRKRRGEDGEAEQGEGREGRAAFWKHKACP